MANITENMIQLIVVHEFPPPKSLDRKLHKGQVGVGEVVLVGINKTSMCNKIISYNYCPSFMYFKYLLKKLKFCLFVL